MTSAILVLAAQSAQADAMTAADVDRCKAMAATLAPKKAEIEKMTARRDELAELTETRGEAWENAEAMRNFSAQQAVEADESRKAYEESRRRLKQTEQALQAVARQFNQDVSAYNQSCSTE